MKTISPKNQLLISSLVLVGGSIALLIWSWQTWPDILVDFGRELYVPWRITQGEMLYRDIAHLHGPLSPYFNALLFSIFGVSLNTLVIANFLWVILLAAMIFRLVASISDYRIGTLNSLVFLTVFAFSQYVGIANYNFICPYSHEITHGVVLSFASLFFFNRYLASGKMADLAAVGLAVGLVFLTKPEVFVACAFSLAVGFFLVMATGDTGSSHKRKSILLLLLSGVCPPLLAYVILSFFLGWTDAFHVLLFGYLNLGNPEVSGLPFYRNMSGLNDIAGNLLIVLQSSAFYFFVVLGGGVVGYLAGKFREKWAAPVYATLVGAFAIFLFWSRKGIDWGFVVRGFPLSLCIVILVSLWILRQRASVEARPRIILHITMACFALALLGKILLNARIFHYGFALSMPATLILCLVLLHFVPRWVHDRGGSRFLVQGLFTAAIAVFVFVHLEISNTLFGFKKTIVTNGIDTIRSDWRGAFVQRALKELAAVIEPGDTLAVLPEGVMINYLLRIENPTPYVNLMPHEIMMFGKANIMKRFMESPPDYVALVHKDTSEYGYRFFGRDYGREINDWVVRNYIPFKIIGSPPLRSQEFGIALLKKKM